MHVVFVDNALIRNQFQPFSETRPVADLRIGILTVAEKWAVSLKANYSFLSSFEQNSLYKGIFSYLDCPRVDFRPVPIQPQQEDWEPLHSIILISGLILPDSKTLEKVIDLKDGNILLYDQQNFIAKFSGNHLVEVKNSYTNGEFKLKGFDWEIQPDINLKLLQFPEEIIAHIGSEIKNDIERLKMIKTFEKIDTLVENNQVLGSEIYIEEGIKANLAILNTLDGPIFLGKNSVILEGAIIKGPFSLGENSMVKMGAQIYPNVSVGPFCKVGGELNSSQIWGYTNKGHHGYLGSSVIGAGCNWGAGTSNSNMKNNFSFISIQKPSGETKRTTHLRYFGVLMGDYVRTAINTSLNTGCYIGPYTHIMGSGLTNPSIPPLSWVKNQGEIEKYNSDKLLETLKNYFSSYGKHWKYEVEEKLIQNIK